MSKARTVNIEQVEALLASIRTKIHSIPTKQKVFKDVTFAQLKVLRFLATRQSASMTDIAQALDVALPTASGLVDNLVQTGYLKRHHQTTDRRLVLVGPTAKVRKLLGALTESRQELLRKIRNSLTPANWTKFVAALQTINAILEPEKEL
jgi:DNA-binding MarR family transcriptional regulator